MKRFLPILLITILLLTTVNAQQEDFNAFGPVIIKTLQCTQYQFPITITNTGELASTYYLEVDGSAAQWIKFAPASFNLQPGQSIVVQSFLDTPCDASGDYTLDIYILTSYGLEKVIMQDISVEKPLNVDIKANVFSQTIAPCQTAEYDLTIVNPATFTETYTLSLDRFENQAELSQEQVTLPANTSKDITIKITPNNCEQTGDHTIVFSAEAEKTGTIAEIDLQLEIEDSGIPIIAEGIKTIKSNLLEESAAEISIFNKGETAKEYTILVEGQSWVTADTASLAIEKQKSEKFNLYIQPPEGTGQGEYPVKITVTDEAGSEYSKEIAIILRSPTFIGKLFSDYLWQTIVGIIIFVLIVVGIYFLANKLTSEEYKLARAKRKRERTRKKAELKKQKEKIKAEKEKEKQRKEKELEREREKAIQKYEKKIKSEYELISKDEIIEGKRAPVNWLRNLILFFVILILLAIAVTFRSVLWANKYYVLLGLIILAALLIIRQLSRLGKTIARWRGIILANEALLMHIGWKKGLHQLSFKLDSPAKRVKVISKKGRTRHAKYVHPKEMVYQYFRIASSVQDIDLKESRCRFKVSKKWLRKKEIKEDDVKLAVLRHGSYSKLKTIREGADEKYVYYRAATDVFGQFAIVGKTSAKEKKKSYLGYVIALIILVILGAGVIALIMSSDAPITVKGIPPQIWEQDTPHSLELNKYFSDPDGDKLDYHFESPPNMDVQINNGIVYFTPDQGWSGQRVITFTADDCKGGEVKSNPVTLVVKKKLLPQSLVSYLKYVLAGIIILILIFAIILLRKPVMKWLAED
ncbi:PGF-pre-PGF domain-containing protein [Candidatus Woesearchaeota archaeon]|nr:PGF-pre-PGF domain-containing protein [Candidatus Woesearchaeota archaeon]MBW3006424.1 PGF-pre-PGF domain-containing protein [Candidatus Woesearchaeota archaeon]